MIIMILIILESVLMQANGNSSPLRPSRRSHHIHYVNFPPSPPRLSRKSHSYVAPTTIYIYIYIYIRTEFYAVSSPPPGVAKNGRRRNFDWRMERMKLKQMDLFSEINYKRRY